MIGPSFPHRLLAAVSPDPAQLDFALAPPRALGASPRARPAASPSTRSYHAIAQDTIYESILRARRKAIHQQIANAIETEYAGRLGEFAGMLAYHFGRAENVAKAGEYLAARRRRGRCARPRRARALVYFQEAARLYLRCTARAATRS